MSVVDVQYPDGEESVGGRPTAGFSAEVAKAAPMLDAFSGVFAGTAPKPGEGYVPVMRTVAGNITIPAAGAAWLTLPKPFPRCIFAAIVHGTSGMFAYGPYSSTAALFVYGPPGTHTVCAVAWGC